MLAMGNICCGAKEEATKQNVLFPSAGASNTTTHDEYVAEATHARDLPRQQQQHQEQQDQPQPAGQGNGSDPLLPSSPEPGARENVAVDSVPIVEDAENNEIEAFRLEQERLDVIVQTASRKMVSVRSTRGSNAYYDQGFAAALSQHLEQTTKFRDSVELPLPDAHPCSVWDRLSEPVPWEQTPPSADTAEQAPLAPYHQFTGIMNKGESPHDAFDRVAEAFLEKVLPKKEVLFDHVEPMVESLL